MEPKNYEQTKEKEKVKESSKSIINWRVSVGFVFVLRAFDG